MRLLPYANSSSSTIGEESIDVPCAVNNGTDLAAIIIANVFLRVLHPYGDIQIIAPLQLADVA